MAMENGLVLGSDIVLASLVVVRAILTSFWLDLKSGWAILSLPVGYLGQNLTKIRAKQPAKQLPSR